MNVHIYRSASKGKVFTRNEKLNIIEARKISEARKASINELVAIEKNKIAAARVEREKSREVTAKVYEFKIQNPGAAVKRKKDGSRYVRLRGENGRMASTVKVA